MTNDTLKTAKMKIVITFL